MNRARVARLVSLWQKRLLLDHWDIDIKYSSVSHPDGDSTPAACEAWTSYHFAEITIYPEFGTYSREACNQAIAHEVAHLLTWELAQLLDSSRDGEVVTERSADEADERLTEHIAKALFRAYRS